MGRGIEACLVPATGWPGIALHPGFGPLPSGNNNEYKIRSEIFSVMVPGVWAFNDMVVNKMWPNERQ